MPVCVCLEVCVCVCVCYLGTCYGPALGTRKAEPSWGSRFSLEDTEPTFPFMFTMMIGSIDHKWS